MESLFTEREGEWWIYRVSLGVTYGVKHAYPEVWKRWFETVKRDLQWKGNMVGYSGTLLEGDECLGCRVGRVFMYCTEEILARDPRYWSNG